MNGDLRSHRFRHEREADWRKLEGLLGRLEKNRIGALSDEELLALPVLYRGALSSLSVARATSLDASLVEYLESLSARAYFFVYGGRSTLPQKLASFFLHDWPAAVRGLWRQTLLCLLINGLATVTAFVMVRHAPDWFYSFVSPDLAGDRGPEASTEALRKMLYDDNGGDGLSVFATYLFTHNSGVALMAFALGFAFGVPTAALMVMNGLMLGGFLALYVERGLGFEIVGWLMIHGATELFAIVLAGAAGFRIGWALAFPGEASRIDAAAEAGRQAGLAMAGVVVMLLIAGALEGFGRQLITSDLIRYAIAGGSLTLWLAYFYWPRRSRAA